jgi:hypothetical protein
MRPPAVQIASRCGALARVRDGLSCYEKVSASCERLASCRLRPPSTSPKVDGDKLEALDQPAQEALRLTVLPTGTDSHSAIAVTSLAMDEPTASKTIR